MIDIVIIDSGVKDNFDSYHSLKGFTVSESDDKFYIDKDIFIDENGHGTAVADILVKNLTTVTITMVKIYNDILEASESKFLFALEYISNNIKCDILH